MKAYFTHLSKSLPDAYLTGEKATIMIQAPEGSELPMAWDAGFEIKDGSPKTAHRLGSRELHISGGAGASGWGTCNIVVPLPKEGQGGKDNDYFLDVYEGSEECLLDELATVLGAHGYEVVFDDTEEESNNV
jgi:hypothetical protein